MLYNLSVIQGKLYKYIITKIISEFYVSVNSNCDHPLPGRTPGNLTFRKKFGQIPYCGGENHRQIPQGVGKKHGQMPLRPGWPDTHDCLYLMCTERIYHMYSIIMYQSHIPFETNSATQEATTVFLKSLLLFQTLNKGIFN